MPFCNVYDISMYDMLPATKIVDHNHANKYKTNNTDRLLVMYNDVSSLCVDRHFLANVCFVTCSIV